MPNLKPISSAEAAGKVKQMFEGIQKSLGLVPNMTRVMANSPAVLNAYLGFAGALAAGNLSGKLREQIALAVAEANQCNYCLSAHNALGQLAGLSAEELKSAQHAEGPDAKTAAGLRFAVKAVRERGHLPESEVDVLRATGYTDGEIAEIIAAVALNTFTNYFNGIAATEIDFPVVKATAVGGR